MQSSKPSRGGSMPPASRTLRRLVALTIAAAAVMSQAPTVARAQQGGQAAADQSLGLEEVVVTARKRAESLIEVPVAVSVLSQADIENRGIASLTDVALFTPGLSYFDSIQNQLGTPVIRGISQTNLNSPDRNVAVFYGGVYLSNLSATNLEILDVERIEVVKGPQSALYGRNAFNGAINYVPADGTRDPMARFSVTAGNHNRRELKLTLSGPMGESFRGRITTSYNTYDGSWKNFSGGDNLGGYETKNFSGVLDFEPNDAFAAKLFGYYTDDTRGPSPSYFYSAQTCGPTGRPLSGVCGEVQPRTWLAANPDVLAFQRKVKLGALDLSYDFGPVTLKSQTARYQADLTTFSDYDLGANEGRGQLYPIIRLSDVTSLAATPAAIAAAAAARITPTQYAYAIAAPVVRRQLVPLYTNSGSGYTRTTSQELRLESSNDSALRWSVGGFYQSNAYNSLAGAAFDGRALAAGEIPRDALQFSLIPGIMQYTNPRNAGFTTNLERRDKQYAYFGGVEYNITDALRVGAEARRDREEREQVSVLIGPSSLQKTTQRYTTWRGHVDFALTPSQRFYASAAKGVISGYFNATFDSVAQAAVPANLQAYQPAENKTYEIGWKAEWLDRRLATEIAIYDIDYTNIQINGTPPPPLITNLIQNIGKATSKGFELNVNFALTDAVTVGATYSHAKAEFAKGTPEPSIARYCGAAAGLALGFCPTTTLNGVLVPNVGGNSLPRAPDKLASGYLAYDQSFSDGWALYGRADVSYTSDAPALTSPQFAIIPARTLVNARIGFRHNKLDVALWARNLFDKKYVSSVIYQPNFVAAAFLPNVTQGERGTYGLTMNYRFVGE